jgi:hypothetical protein
MESLGAGARENPGSAPCRTAWISDPSVDRKRPGAQPWRVLHARGWLARRRDRIAQLGSGLGSWSSAGWIGVGEREAWSASISTKRSRCTRPGLPLWVLGGMEQRRELLVREPVALLLGHEAPQQQSAGSRVAAAGLRRLR